MRTKRGLFVLVVLAVAAALTTSAGAANRGNAKIDLSTRGGVAVYLASHGISMKGVVIQRGARNYAGPSCPGKGWTCTTATRVVQIAKDGGGNSQGGGGNSFVCSATGGSPMITSTSPNGCTIVQYTSSGSGSNTARCVESSSNPTTSQSCSIIQTVTGSGTGSNTATIQQQIGTYNGSTQLGNQYGGVNQSSSTGSNSIQITQNVTESTTVTDAGGNQTQNGHQNAAALQNSSTGKNSVTIGQTLTLSATANSCSEDGNSQGGGGNSQGGCTSRGPATITQNQNTDGSVNENASVEQDSTSGAENASVVQTNRNSEFIGKATTGTQTQGSSGVSGQNVSFTQNSLGLATIASQQHEYQTENVYRVTNLTQNQFDPQWADPQQHSNTGDTYTIGQDSHQNASNPTTQESDQYAECHTDGLCTITELIQQQGITQPNSCSGKDCNISNTVHNEDGELFTGTCPSFTVDSVPDCVSEGDPPSPPSPPGINTIG